MAPLAYNYKGKNIIESERQGKIFFNRGHDHFHLHIPLQWLTRITTMWSLWRFEKYERLSNYYYYYYIEIRNPKNESPNYQQEISIFHDKDLWMINTLLIYGDTISCYATNLWQVLAPKIELGTQNFRAACFIITHEDAPWSCVYMTYEACDKTWLIKTLVRERETKILSLSLAKNAVPNEISVTFP